MTAVKAPSASMNQPTRLPARRTISAPNAAYAIDPASAPTPKIASDVTREPHSSPVSTSPASTTSTVTASAAVTVRAGGRRPGPWPAARVAGAGRPERWWPRASRGGLTGGADRGGHLDHLPERRDLGTQLAQHGEQIREAPVGVRRDDHAVCPSPLMTMCPLAAEEARLPDPLGDDLLAKPTRSSLDRGDPGQARSGRTRARRARPR